MTDSNNNADDSSSPRDDEGESTSPEQSRVEVFHTEYGEYESPTQAVVTAVSAVEGVEPAGMERLYDSIDPDALDALMAEPVGDGDDGAIEVEFRYAGYRVRVRNDGGVVLLQDDE